MDTTVDICNCPFWMGRVAGTVFHFGPFFVQIFAGLDTTSSYGLSAAGFSEGITKTRLFKYTGNFNTKK